MSEIKDPYDDQLRAARYRAERDQARQECERLRARLRDSVPRAAYDRLRERLLGHIRECETALGKRNAQIKNMGRHIDSLYKMLRDANDADDAAAWVRDHGGLDAVKNLHDNGELPLCDLCEILGLDRVNTSWMDAFRELEKRLMPEGMEWLVEAWPRFEDYAPVHFCDDFERDGEQHGVGSVGLCADGSFSVNYLAYSKGERVKRPAKVLDADGAEIHVGDTVWLVDGGRPYTVKTTSGRLGTVEFEADEWTAAKPCAITHRAPILAADGRPLREGETVWDTSGKRQFKVLGFGSDAKLGEHTVKTVGVDGMALEGWSKPSDLTHSRPDSKEQLERDIRSFAEDNSAIPHDVDQMERDVADLVRRGMALAERGQ